MKPYEKMIKAIIFDMDGVISDTQKLHSKVESEILSRFGVNLSPEEITRKYSGVKTSEFFDQLLRERMGEYSLEELMREKWNRMATLAKKEVEAIEGSIELIKSLYNSGHKMAVASASNQEYVRSVIKSLEVEKYFKHLISGDMVKKGKPDPEIFLLAASKLETEPGNCLVIEDGRSGMEAAKRAGMKCIGLVKDQKEEYPTRNLTLSLGEIDINNLGNLL